jgi:hypothetical protein
MNFSRQKQINIGRTAIFLLCVLFLAHSAYATESITDNFDSDSNNWTVSHNKHFKIIDGSLINNTVYSDYIGLKEKDIGDFNLTFMLKFLSNNEEMPGHFAITINRGYGTWKLYFTSNKNTSQFTSKFYAAGAAKNAKALFNEVHKLPLPLDKELKIEITCSRQRYELKVADKKILLGTAPGYGTLTFGSYKQPVALDNFVITYEKPAPLSPNLLINGSFEYATNPDIPDYWAGNGKRYRTQGLTADLYTEKALGIFHEKFYLDKQTAFDGKNSMRIQAPFHLQSKNINVKPNNNYTISFYIKASNNGQTVSIGATPDAINTPFKDNIITVNKEWSRHELHLTDYPQKSLSFFVNPLTADKIWVDAIQIEAGNEATPFMPCWHDDGFLLPEDVNQNQCLSNTHAVRKNTHPKHIIVNSEIIISEMKLVSKDPLNKSYNLLLKVENKTDKKRRFNVTACLTAKSESEQVKVYSKEFPPKEIQSLEIMNFKVSDLRVCVNILVVDEQGNTIKQIRDFIDTPEPMRIYTEWSYYTNEKEANIIVQFAENYSVPKNSTLQLSAFATGHPQYPLVKKTFPVKDTAGRQIFVIPTSRLIKEKLFTVTATLINDTGKKLISASARLITHYPTQTEVKINRINRGVYVNKEPFIPYGILVSGLETNQLEYYKSCGFSYIQLVSHWNKIEKNLTFLENCNNLDINVIAFHVSRPYSVDPADIVEKYSLSPAFIGIVPNDESASLSVYDRAIRVTAANPTILNCVNNHFISYRAFANRIDGFPGDVLSIDRYPFIMQPIGRPQMTGDIFSYELCLEMMNRDARRERKPVFVWLQGAESFAKEPTVQQLTWQTYIALVNNCMGFTYFGGIPNSEIVWERMQSLNQEVQTLKPVLFSMEKDPKVFGANQVTEDNIRILAKKLGNEITVICVNDSFYSVNAAINLSETGSSKSAEILFEGRKCQIDEKGILKDVFAPFERHVYRIRIK